MAITKKTYCLNISDVPLGMHLNQKAFTFNLIGFNLSKEFLVIFIIRAYILEMVQ